MTQLPRRSLLGLILAAPAIVRTPGLLMPVRRVESAPLVLHWLADDQLAVHNGVIVRERVILHSPIRRLSGEGIRGDQVLDFREEFPEFFLNNPTAWT